MRRRHNLILTAALAVGATGCQKTLFTEPVPRNQFVTFDQMRGTGESLEVVDEFGHRSPNLRYRLQGTSR